MGTAYRKASSLLNLHALQFIIVLRVIIVHFGVILMKLMQVNLYDLLQRFYKTCEIDCKGNDFF
ncbi:hypothetical protein DW263_01055 [Segatella copri]|nr:hypothetical protein DW263_01055 [Segatella copri]